jgi:AcrR family transcriptional regulator
MTTMEVARTRDADATRDVLLTAARRRFAASGYSTTTVREIAADAGVNVALINRYFSSKEGLFEACLTWAAKDLDRPTEPSIERMVERFVSTVASSPTDDQSIQIMLLLRSSGDERADAIRTATLRRFTERIAEIAGWAPDIEGADALLLRAQLAICTGLGIVMLRASTAVEPVSSATVDDLRGPLARVFSALLG